MVGVTAAKEGALIFIDASKAHWRYGRRRELKSSSINTRV